ncbi:hypothetical protein JYU34_002296 [Plutella xylostella]|uniref:Uncharacterized protein n=1 Tax=Plutella xylostella TaxID=51655 RepID=A0ABQ7R1V7_PLUXY|nr:hypothetical protein JYU34_002296 [Plutella xylostella]
MAGKITDGEVNTWRRNGVGTPCRRKRVVCLISEGKPGRIKTGSPAGMAGKVVVNVGTAMLSAACTPPAKKLQLRSHFVSVKYLGPLGVKIERTLTMSVQAVNSVY